MSPLVAALLALVGNLVAAVIAAGSRPREARIAVGIGAAGTVIAAGLAAIPLLLDAHVATWRLGGLALRADALTSTLLLPLAIAVGVMAIASPVRGTTPRAIAALAVALAGAIGALIADSLVLLVLAEAVIGAAALAGLPAGKARLGAVYLGVAGLFAGAALVLAALHGELRIGLADGAPVSLDVAGLLLVAIAIRLGAPPAQSGITSALQAVPGVGAVALAAPLGGVALLIRVVQPALTNGVAATALTLTALVLAFLAAAIAVRASDLGRAAGWTVAALHGLLLAGNLEQAATGALGGELMWAGLVVAEVGFLVAVTLVTVRLGPVDLSRLHGFAPSAPWLSLTFLLLALAIAGIPGTLEFVAADVLLAGSHSAGLAGTIATVLVLALIGWNALRLHFRVFFGERGTGTVDMDLRPAQRTALLAVIALLFAGGLTPGLIPLVSKAGEALEHRGLGEAGDGAHDEAAEHGGRVEHGEAASGGARAGS